MRRAGSCVRGGSDKGDPGTTSSLDPPGFSYCACCQAVRLLVAHALISTLQATDASSIVITCMWPSLAYYEAVLAHRFCVL